MTDSNNDDQITVTTDEQALAMVLERANIEIDELRQMGEEEFADEAAAAYDQVKEDFEAAQEDD
jgi:hypothetical protein